MGKAKYLSRIGSLFEKSPGVSFRSIERIVGSGYAKLLVSGLIKKNKIIKLTKGFYTKHNEIGLSVFCFKPAYLGLQSALSYHKVWEQETIPVIITSKKVRVGTRRIGENNILVRKTDKKYFFGWSFEKEGQFYFPYSDLEKTAIDMFVFRQELSPETFEKVRKKLNMNKLKKYLKNYSLKTQRNILSRL